MPHHSTVFNQLFHPVPRHQLEQIVKEHAGERNVKKFTRFQQLMVMLFAQLCAPDNLREIETALMAHQSRWYYPGLRTVKHSTAGDPNCSHP
ncbi:MAG: DUF4372 domain-containing protein [Candidatus Hydrogenedentota bacterium]|nr:MAG: DUF4372 domain-containing protein [Candidatus Hydrogenedentota bacterium]